MEKEVERGAGQDLQIDLDPREGLEAGSRPTKLLEEKLITREFNQYGGCHKSTISSTRVYIGFPHTNKFILKN